MCGAVLQIGPPAGERPAPPAGDREVLPSGRPLRVLHLEDSPSDAELARESLAEEGIACEVRRVETRAEFEAALAAGDLDLIIADFQLPAFDGVTAFLLARELRPEVPFIMLTGKLGEEYAIDALKLGVADYVLKQSLGRLGGAVHRALLGRREREQRLAAEEQLRRHREHLEGLVRRRTAEVEDRNAQLARANRDLETLVASLSHDLRTPLVVIGGYARLLERRLAGASDAQDLELLRGLTGATGRLERLLDDMLAFFRASTASLERGPIDVQAAVQAAFAEAAALAGGRELSLRLGALPAGYGDAAMVRQVFVNLLTNAVKFTASREAAVIEVSGWEDAGATGYCVRDNGVGFDMRDSGRLFGVFQRLHDDPGFPGTGVGLATVRRIVEKHGGEVWALAAVDQGANFCFTLPKAGP